jgi:4-hydroxy-tetrahydrodipicolinate synthase
MMSLPRPLRGIVVPIVTPLRDGGTLDEEGLGRLLEHVLAGGVRGIFVLGTTGEAAGLPHRLRKDLVRRSCRLVAGRVPVLVGITDTVFEESAILAREAAEAGAQAVVLAPPYYFPAGQPELLEYLGHLLPRLSLPLFLYNIPRMTKVSFEPDTVGAAAALPGVAGIKDSSEDMTYFHRLREVLRGRPDFSLLTGSELLLGESILYGAHGGVLGGANLFPRLYVELYEAAAAGDLSRVRGLTGRVMQVAATLYGVGRHHSSWLKGLKCALSLKGICGDFMLEPFHRFREEERRKIQEALERLEQESR